ncbi:MAG TPA: diguanylate cyclase [Miltoncostaeaceae bacterium]|nr:diguanylate cyclase [Miltoncostaeaceae bacterium]
MPIEMRYRRSRCVADGTRGRQGLRDAPLRLVPPSPVPQVDWEDAVRRIAWIRRRQLALVGVVAALTVAAPVAVATLHVAHARPIVVVVGAVAAAALVGWAALDRALRRVVDGLGRSARVLAGLAATDPLTELPNHRAFQERLHEECARALRAGAPLSLVLLDLDHFARINDRHGHPAGDAVVREVARRLRECARDGEMVARIGGEEFAWLLPGDEMDAWQAAERARQAVEAEPVATDIRLTISAGVCELGQAGSPMELLRLADGALYWAKAHGRNRSVRYSPDVVEELSDAERAARLEHQQALNAVLALARAVDAKDPYTMRHSQRVAEMAVRVALEMGWSADRVRLLHEAAVLHDVGKIAVPDLVLTKPGRLSDEEFALVREHAVRGAEIVAETLTPEQVAWVRGHHERFDGAGYPDGLAGHDIPDGARILALADAWDAMTSDRPYRRGMSASRAFGICGEERRAQFCPDVVAALTRLWEAGALAAAGDDSGDDSLGTTPLQYRGVPAAGIGRRRDRATVSGSGLVYRGQTIREAPPRR